MTVVVEFSFRVNDSKHDLQPTLTCCTYGGSTDIDTDAKYPKFNTDILIIPVFYTISILCFKVLIESYYLRLLAL
mgnify:CR=1 FL=1